MRTCYGRNDPRWDCDEWLSKTPSVCDLPSRSSGKPSVRSRTRNKNEIIKGPVKTGDRGGRYFEIIETTNGKVACTVRVYLPSSKCKGCVARRKRNVK